MQEEDTDGDMDEEREEEAEKEEKEKSQQQRSSPVKKAGCSAKHCSICGQEGHNKRTCKQR